jgi:hypothetical protein
MVPDLPRFLRQAPELFRLIPGSLGRYAVFRTPTNIGKVTTVIHETPTASVPGAPRDRCSQRDS